MFFLFLHLTNCRINIHYPKSRKSFTFTENVLENQIIHGYFGTKGNINCKYQVSISGKENGIQHFYNESIDKTETNYAFNINEPSEFEVTLVPVVVDNARDYETGKVSYNMASQINTFQKEVAKDAKLGPALQTLTWMDDLLLQVIKQTEMRHMQLNALMDTYNRSIRIMSAFSVITFLVVASFNFYQVYSMKQFFRKKKMI